ncbi:MAG: hypothetical protein LQ350_003149 [Teloschistes chrysophthalmus]|nr:MAG: hypothetical protein LQ350_003149 [Niorma chrysophthalma]
MAVAAALRNAWSQVLDIDEDEIDDEANFLELGGDSVKAIKLIEVAPSCGINLDAETVFREGTFSRLLAGTTLREQDKLDEEVASNIATDKDVIETCAQACNLATDMVEDVFPADWLTRWYFTSHQKDGVWRMQQVYEVGEGLDAALACKAFEVIRERNPAFRTHCVSFGEEIMCVVARNPIEWIESDSLEKYREENSRLKMTSGRPLVAYGLVKESEKTYIVWTALHAVMDAWTRKLQCDDLDAYLNDPEGFLSKPKRPSYKRLLEFKESKDWGPSQAWWDNYHADLGPQKPLVPTLVQNPDMAMNRKVAELMPTPSFRQGTIRLSTIGHTALALVIASFTKTEDIVFYGTRGSRTLFPGAESIIGCVVNAVALRTYVRPTDKAKDLMQRTQDEYVDMMPHEALGFQNLLRLYGKQDTFPQVMLNWYSQGIDTQDRLMGGKGNGGSLKFVEEAFVPLNRAGAFLSVWEQGDVLKVQRQYDDRMFSDQLITEYVRRFQSILTRLCKSDSTTLVQEFLDW